MPQWEPLKPCPKCGRGQLYENEHDHVRCDECDFSTSRAELEDPSDEGSNDDGFSVEDIRIGEK